MIDLKALRDDPDRFKAGAAAKQMAVDIDRVLTLDERRRELITQQESLRADQKKLAKESGPAIGRLMASSSPLRTTRRPRSRRRSSHSAPSPLLSGPDRCI